MIGIDLEKIERFSKYIYNLDFIEIILSDKERQEYEQVKNKQLFLATRFTAKEALFKALNNQEDFNFSAVTVAHTSLGKPYFSEYEGIFLTISHTDDLVTAMVLNGVGL